MNLVLQIEEATRLTVRLSERSGRGRQTHDFRIKKAGRFRGGASAAVAEVTFGDGESYLALKDGGIVDMDATMRRLDRMREFIAGMSRGLKKVVDCSKKGLTKAAWSGGSHNESREPYLVGLNLQLARPNNQAPHSIPQTFRTTQPIGLGGLTSCAASRQPSSTVFSQRLPFIALTRFWGVCFRSQRLRLARLMGEFPDGFLTVSISPP